MTNTLFHFFPKSMNYQIKIKNLENIEADLWNSFISQADNVLPFASLEYSRIFSKKDVFFVIACCEKENKILGGVVGRLKGRLPLLGNNLSVIILETGVVVAEENERKYPQIKKEIYESLNEYAKEKKATHIFLNHWSRETDQSLLRESGFSTNENHTSEIRLPEENDDLFNLYTSICRNTIRKGIKKGVITEITSGVKALDKIPEIEQLSGVTYERAHKKSTQSSMQLKSSGFYRKLFHLLGDNAVLGIAYTPDRRPISFAIMLKTERTMVYYRGGSDLILNREYSSSNLLLHSLIEYAKEAQIVKIDMGGIPVSPSKTHPAYGVFKFKQSFGGSVVSYNSGIKVLSPFRYWLFKNLIFNKLVFSLYRKIKPVS